MLQSACLLEHLPTRKIVKTHGVPNGQTANDATYLGCEGSIVIMHSSRQFTIFEDFQT